MRLGHRRAALFLLVTTSVFSMGPAGAWHGAPHLTASVPRDSISLGDWTPSTTVDVKIFESQGGPLMHELSLDVDDAGNRFEFLDPWTMGLEEGNFLVASEGSLVKELLLRNVTVDIVDNVNDVASGRAPPGAELYVQPDPDYPITTGPDSVWHKDFGAVGIDVPEGARVGAGVADEDGDVSEGWNETPTIYAHLGSNNSHVGNVSAYGDVTLEIYDHPAGEKLAWMRTTGDGGGPPDAQFEFGFETRAGMFFVATDHITKQVKTHVVRDLTIALIDDQSDVIAGRTWPGARVTVWSGDNAFSAPDILADENGTWSVDLGELGFDIMPDSDLKAHVSDEGDQDTTVRFGREDEAPPSSRITNTRGDIVAYPLFPVSGTSWDEDSWIESVSVLFQPLRGDGLILQATLDCPDPPAFCSWTVDPPLVPGVYEVTAQARDTSGNVDEPGVSVDLIVL